MDNQRREFLQQAAISGACFLCSGIGGILFSSCEKPADIEEESSLPLIEGEPIISIAEETALQNNGGAVKKRFAKVNGGRVIVILRISATSFAAYSAQCTHQGTEINLPANSVMICPNHGSRFSTADGGVIQGPAAAALTKFQTSFNQTDNTVTIG